MQIIDTDSTKQPVFVAQLDPALVDAICISMSGWMTDEEHNRYLNAGKLVRNHAKKLHLEAELKKLKND